MTLKSLKIIATVSFACKIMLCFSGGICSELALETLKKVNLIKVKKKIDLFMESNEKFAVTI